MVLCFCHRPSAGSPSGPEKQPVPIPALPIAPPPAKLAPQRFGIDNNLPVPARPCTPPHLTSTSAHSYPPHPDGCSPQPRRSPSRCPIPKIPDFEGLVDSETDSDDELLQLSRVHAQSSTAFPATGSPGPSTPKKASAAGGAGGSGTDSSSLSPLSSLMSRIGSIGRGSPSHATGPCGLAPEAAKSTDNLVIAAHRAEVRRLSHKRMQEELQKERQPYSMHSYKRSTMSTIKEDATDASPRCSATKEQKRQQSQAPALEGSPLRKCVEYDVVKSTEDLSVPIVVSRKLEKDGDSFPSSVSTKSESKPEPTAPRAFALQGKTRVKLPKGLAVRGGSRNSRSKDLREWLWSSLGADKPVGKDITSPEVPPVPDSQDVSRKQVSFSDTDATSTAPKSSMKDAKDTKGSPEETAGSFSSVDEDCSIHEACKARVVTLGQLSKSSVHPLSSGSAAWGALDGGTRQHGLHPSLPRIAKHDRGSSEASRISTLNLPSPYLHPSLASEGESRRALRRIRGSSSHDDSIQLSLPSKYFDYAAALEAADIEAHSEGKSTNAPEKTRSNGVSNIETLVGDLEKMSEDWHQQISQIQKDSPVRPIPFHQMRLSQTWPHAMQLPSLRADQHIESEDPFKAADSGFDVFENSARGVDGSLLAPTARRQSRRDRHTMAFDTRDMDIAWWKDTNNKPTSVEANPLLSNTIESKLVNNACYSDQKEVVESVPEAAASPKAESPEEQRATVSAKSGTTGFEKVIRARLKKALSRKQISRNAGSPPLYGRSLLTDDSPCDRKADQSLDMQSTIVEASQSPRQSSSQLASQSKERLTPDGNEMTFEVSEKDCLQLAGPLLTPESKKELVLESGSQESQGKPLSQRPEADAGADTCKDVDSIFGAWVELEKSQDTAPTTPVNAEEVKADSPVCPGHDNNPNLSVPSTPVASAYAEVSAYIASAFSSPQLPRAIHEVQHESPGSSYKDAVSSHDITTAHPTSKPARSNFNVAFSLKSDMALPKLALDSVAPCSKYNTWNGRANPTKPRLMKSTVQFSSELESIFLGKKRDNRDGKENKENINSMPHAISGHD